MRADARRNRELILCAARELFGQGAGPVQIDDVAARAGVGVGTVYRHFATKEALIGALVRERFEGFVETARAALDSDADAEGDPFELLAGVLRANAEAMSTDTATWHALMGASDEVWAYAAPARDELMALGAELVARAHRAGTLRPDFTADDIPMIMCGVCATMGRGDDGFDWRRHLELVLDGLRAQR